MEEFGATWEASDASQQAGNLQSGFAGAGDEAFCSGGDQGVRGAGGYIGADSIPRLNVLDLQAGLCFLVEGHTKTIACDSNVILTSRKCYSPFKSSYLFHLFQKASQDVSCSSKC